MRAALAILLILIGCVVVTAQAPRSTLKVGDKAPDFALPNGDGKLVMLSQYTAVSPVVIVFYRGFW